MSASSDVATNAEIGVQYAVREWCESLHHLDPELRFTASGTGLSGTIHFTVHGGPDMIFGRGILARLMVRLESGQLTWISTSMDTRDAHLTTDVASGAGASHVHAPADNPAATATVPHAQEGQALGLIASIDAWRAFHTDNRRKSNDEAGDDLARRIAAGDIAMEGNGTLLQQHRADIAALALAPARDPNPSNSVWSGTKG